MTVTCACCGIAAEDLAALEPYFGLPDVISRLPRSDIGRMGPGVIEHRAMVSSDACTLDYDDDAKRQCFLRLVMPFPVTDRPTRPVFHYGVWVKISRAVFVLYAEAYAQDMGHPTAAKEIITLASEYSGKLANDLGPRVATTSTLDRVVTITPTRGRERWKTSFPETDDHPLAQRQRDGIDVATTLEWTKPLHLPMN